MVYFIKEITFVHQTNDYSIIFIGDEKIAKVSVSDENYALLLNRLRYEGVEFYKD